MNIAENLQTLIDVKEDIKRAISNKGSNIIGGMSTYAESIRNISSVIYIPDGMKFAYSEFQDFNYAFNTSKVTNMWRMFYFCNSLTSLDISNFDFSNVTNINYFLPTDGNKLIDIRFGKNLKIDWTGTGSPNSQSNLSKESLLSIIDGLYDFVGNGETTTRSCQFGATNLAKLTSGEIARATAKGWTLLS